VAEQAFTPGMLNRWLLDAHLAHWLRHSVPEGREDYVESMDRQWRGTPGPPYHLVAAARLLYSFSVGALAGGGEPCLRAADRMYRFLLSRFRDAEHGGWFWAVGDAGPAEPEKRTYGQVFAILALATFAHAAGQDEPLELAKSTRRVLDQRAWEPAHGGYGQTFDRQWRLQGPGKRLNEQMHALEALAALVEMTDADEDAAAVYRVCELTCDRLLRPWGGIYEFMTADWGKDRETVVPGHQLEFGWLLVHAGNRFGEQRWMDVGRRMIEFGWRHGWDGTCGGVYDEVDDQGRMLRDTKGSWPQCEAIVAALTMARLTGDAAWRGRFAAALGWMLDHLEDKQHGGIFPAADRNGTVTSEHKASAWKAAYHVTQAIWMSAVMLQEMG
jgi:mannose/cellobiose epimerase-like protein (N-acyl-D-glucosamine 2-epimerase family)